MGTVWEERKPELYKEVVGHLNVIEIVIDPLASCRSGNLLHIQWKMELKSETLNFLLPAFCTRFLGAQAWQVCRLNIPLLFREVLPVSFIKMW